VKPTACNSPERTLWVPFAPRPAAGRCRGSDRKSEDLPVVRHTNDSFVERRDVKGQPLRRRIGGCAPLGRSLCRHRVIEFIGAPSRGFLSRPPAQSAFDGFSSCRGTRSGIVARRRDGARRPSTRTCHGSGQSQFREKRRHFFPSRPPVACPRLRLFAAPRRFTLMTGLIGTVLPLTVAR